MENKIFEVKLGSVVEVDNNIQLDVLVLKIFWLLFFRQKS